MLRTSEHGHVGRQQSHSLLNDLSIYLVGGGGEVGNGVGWPRVEIGGNRTELQLEVRQGAGVASQLSQFYSQVSGYGSDRYLQKLGNVLLRIAMM